MFLNDTLRKWQAETKLFRGLFAPFIWNGPELPSVTLKNGKKRNSCSLHLQERTVHAETDSGLGRSVVRRGVAGHGDGLEVVVNN